MKTKTYQNPFPQRADDPWVVRDGDSYLYCYSFGRGVAVTRADSLPEIRRERGKICYRAPKEGMYSQEYWAPELHKINGRWYIYVAADDGINDHHRMYCLGAKTDDPTGEYEMIGKVSDEAIFEMADKATRGNTLKLGCFKPLDRDRMIEIYKMANQ